MRAETLAFSFGFTKSVEELRHLLAIFSDDDGLIGVNCLATALKCQGEVLKEDEFNSFVDLVNLKQKKRVTIDEMIEIIDSCYMD